MSLEKSARTLNGRPGGWNYILYVAKATDVDTSVNSHDRSLLSIWPQHKRQVEEEWIQKQQDQVKRVSKVTHSFFKTFYKFVYISSVSLQHSANVAITRYWKKSLSGNVSDKTRISIQILWIQLFLLCFSKPFYLVSYLLLNCHRHAILYQFQVCNVVI